MSQPNVWLTSFDEMPEAALLSAHDLAILSGRSRTSLWRDVASGRLPKPMRIGPNCVRWRVADARKYLVGEMARVAE